MFILAVPTVYLSDCHKYKRMDSFQCNKPPCSLYSVCAVTNVTLRTRSREWHSPSMKHPHCKVSLLYIQHNQWMPSGRVIHRIGTKTKSYKEWFERFQSYRGIATQSIESSERKKGVE